MASLVDAIIGEFATIWPHNYRGGNQSSGRRMKMEIVTVESDAEGAAIWLR